MNKANVGCGVGKSVKLVSAARQALVHRCLKEGVSDPAEIKSVAVAVASSCRRQQVAGVKARKNYKW